MLSGQLTSCMNTDSNKLDLSETFNFEMQSYSYTHFPLAELSAELTHLSDIAYTASHLTYINFNSSKLMSLSNLPYLKVSIFKWLTTNTLFDPSKMTCIYNYIPKDQE